MAHYPRRRRRFLLAAALALFGAAWIGHYSWRRPNPAASFSDVFGIPAPAEAGEIRARRFFMGGPGDTCTLLTFRCDRLTLDAILRGRAFESNEGGLVIFEESDRDPNALWQHAFGEFAKLDGVFWRAPERIEPMVFRLHHPADNSAEMIDVIWDALSGRAWVRRLIG